MIETGHLKPPGMFQLCLGIAWGQPATPEAMTYMRGLLPANSQWFAFGISLHQFPMVAQAVLLGGHVRVGMEDNLYLARGQARAEQCGAGREGRKNHRIARRERGDGGRGTQNADRVNQAPNGCAEPYRWR